MQILTKAQYFDFRNRSLYCRTEKLVLFCKRRTKNKYCTLYDIGDFIKYKDEMYLYIGVFDKEEDVPTDIQCLYRLDDYIRARKCRLNNIEKWQEELKNNPKKYRFKEYDAQKYLREKKLAYQRNLDYIKRNQMPKSKSSKANARFRTKMKLIDLLGGKCAVCGATGYGLTFDRIDKRLCGKMSDLIRSRGINGLIEVELKNFRLLCEDCRIIKMKEMAQNLRNLKETQKNQPKTEEYHEYN
ncbi:hypothetical protein DLH72_04850 [Candidatus Gracilibacteria bacterium]|nr:MAG: hypothetical protein DLH72_04850 [Candidatus Gracilibacteria bacterium]